MVLSAAARRLHNRTRGQPLSVTIGMGAGVTSLVGTDGSTGHVVNVEDDTEPRMIQPAMSYSWLDEQHSRQEVLQRAAWARAGPKSLSEPHSNPKRKADSELGPPRFRRRFLWSDSPTPHISPTALLTETAPPLPSPPAHLLNDPIIQSSIKALSSSIKVDTPFDVDRLESMLHDHPNQPFVRSVLRGLREGFWPFDEGEWKEECKMTYNYATEPNDLKAIQLFRDKEVDAGRWSPPLPFTSLLPGMKMSPMFVVWQKEKARVVTDHSGSGINEGIPRSEAKVRYDDMHDFGQALRDARRAFPGRPFVTFKSDVASAFLNLPAHPLWQLRQTVNVDGHLHVVRRLVFGNRASPRIWCSVSGLLCWLAVRKLGISDLFDYMDDFFGWDFADNLVFYHGMLRPRKQVQLLIFWDAIRCPFEDRKQEHGDVLKIIGFWVDANNGTLSLAPSSISDILERIDSFLSTPGRCPPLRHWQQLGGHLNWLLNVLPWGRPALSELYRKTSGKSQPHIGVHLNQQVISDLRWLSSIIPKSIGVRFVDDGLWMDHQADMVMWTDASLKHALSFVYASRGFVYPLRPSSSRPADVVDIFFLELMAIMSAIHHVACFASPPRRLLIWTDSLDSVAVFDSLRAAEAQHNAPLLGAASVILRSGIDLRVRHIPGKLNIRADLLSRLLLDEYRLKFPSDRVERLSPPRELLPARWRESF